MSKYGLVSDQKNIYKILGTSKNEKDVMSDLSHYHSPTFYSKVANESHGTKHKYYYYPHEFKCYKKNENNDMLLVPLFFPYYINIFSKIT